MNFYTYPWWKAVVIPTLVKGEEFYDEGKTFVLDQVDVVARRAEKSFDWIKTIFILAAIVSIARLFTKN